MRLFLFAVSSRRTNVTICVVYDNKVNKCEVLDSWQIRPSQHESLAAAEIKITSFLINIIHFYGPDSHLITSADDQ